MNTQQALQNAIAAINAAMQAVRTYAEVAGCDKTQVAQTIDIKAMRARLDAVQPVPVNESFWAGAMADWGACPSMHSLSSSTVSLRAIAGGR